MERTSSPEGKRFQAVVPAAAQATQRSHAQAQASGRLGRTPTKATMPAQEPFPMSRLTIARLTMFIMVLAAAGCERRPDFNIDKAQMELAQAFERDTRQVAIYSDGKGEVPAEWLVDFRIDGVEQSMQARFTGVKAAWVLQEVRVTPAAGEETPWESAGVILGRMRGQAHDRATETMARMRQLADLIGGYSVRNGNRFPDVDNGSLRDLLIVDGQILEKDWKHDADGWGQQFLYHAAPDGLSYILVSARIRWPVRPRLGNLRVECRPRERGVWRALVESGSRHHHRQRRLRSVLRALSPAPERVQPRDAQDDLRAKRPRTIAAAPLIGARRTRHGRVAGRASKFSLERLRPDFARNGLGRSPRLRSSGPGARATGAWREGVARASSASRGSGQTSREMASDDRRGLSLPPRTD